MKNVILIGLLMFTLTSLISFDAKADVVSNEKSKKELVLKSIQKDFHSFANDYDFQAAIMSKQFDPKFDSFDVKPKNVVFHCSGYFAIEISNKDSPEKHIIKN